MDRNTDLGSPTDLISSLGDKKEPLPGQGSANPAATLPEPEPDVMQGQQKPWTGEPYTGRVLDNSPVQVPPPKLPSETGR